MEKVFKYFAAAAVLMSMSSLEMKAQGPTVTFDGLTYSLTTSSDPYDIKRTAILVECAKKGDVVVPDFIDVKDSDVHEQTTTRSEPYSWEGRYAVESEYGAFRNHRQDFTSIVLPKGMKSITGFSDCQTLQSVVLPDSIKDLGYYYFYNTWALQSVTIPEGVVSLGERVFYQSGVSSVTLPSTLETIANSAFEACRNLRSIEIPASVHTLDFGIFSICDYLETAKILCPIEVLPQGMFGKCGSLEYVELPNTIKTIGAGAFGACTMLESITLPKDLTVIEETAFSYCHKLGEIDLPASLDSIGEKAFCDCNGLKLITCRAIIPPKATTFDTFSDWWGTDQKIYQNAVLEVPAESVSAYKSAPVWKNFSTIVPIGTTTGIRTNTTLAESAETYNLNGMKVKGNSRGIAIKRQSNGEVKKVFGNK